MAFAFNPITGKLDLVGSGGGGGGATLGANTFTATQTITAAANTSALTASYSVTGANTTPLLDLSGTWNTTGIARGILLNITDTASAGSSRLLELQTGGTSRLTVDKLGQISSSVSGTSQSAISYGAGSFFLRGDGVFQSSRFEVNGLHGRLDNLGVRIRSTAVLGFCSGDAVTTSSDTILARDAANTLALRNGGTAASPVPQTFRLYNYTDGTLTNFERGFMRWNSNTLEIGTEAGGTGTGRAFDCYSAGTLSARFRGTSFATIYVGLEWVFSSLSSNPTTTDVTAGRTRVIKNTTTGELRLWANDGGTLKSALLS
jgi:hypothetical protein